jgi:tetratricopeptide (TPR) repeat protein
MKLRRFLRDVTVLVAFCGAFYLLITFVNRLDGESSNEASDFSVAREAADSLAQEEDWTAAAEEYRKLTLQDPFNGYAWERYASSFYTMRFAAVKELEALEVSVDSDPVKLEEARKRIAVNGDKAYEILIKVREFARFRGGALLRMAVIDTYRENYDLALEMLQEFVDNHHNTQLGLDKYSQFGRGDKSVLMPGAEVPENCRLHYYPKFWEIVAKEDQNRSKR